MPQQGYRDRDKNMNKTKGLTEKREEGRHVKKSNQEETEVCRSVV
jgi:hypothetical protein